MNNFTHYGDLPQVAIKGEGSNAFFERNRKTTL